MTKEERRAAAREAARIERERRRKREAMTKILVRSVATLVVLAVLAGVGFWIYSATRPVGPGPDNMLSDGVLIVPEDGVATVVETAGIPEKGTPTPTDTSDLDEPLYIVAYVDYLCPFCYQFESTNAGQIRALIEAGQAALEVHPIAILDRASQGSRYSTRAANAAACVASLQPAAFLDAHEALFANQPPEGTRGLTNDELVGILAAAGADSDEVASCVREERYKAWVAEATARALSGPLPNTSVPNVTGTPTVIVNGERYQGTLTNATEFAGFLATVYDDSKAGATPEPEPTP